MKQEKRKYLRITINQMIKLTFGRESTIPVSAANLSEGGILCESPEQIEPYASIYLMFEIPGKTENYNICCEGVVVRSEKIKGKYLTGIEFSNLKEEDRVAIKKFIKEQ